MEETWGLKSETVHRTPFIILLSFKYNDEILKQNGLFINKN